MPEIYKLRGKSYKSVIKYQEAILKILSNSINSAIRQEQVGQGLLTQEILDAMTVVWGSDIYDPLHGLLHTYYKSLLYLDDNDSPRVIRVALPSINESSYAEVFVTRKDDLYLTTFDTGRSQDRRPERWPRENNM